MKSALPLGFLVTSLCFLSACGESQTPSFRQYQEISKTTSLSKQSPSLTWRTPLTWKEKSTQGMRLATFAIELEGQTGLCTIVRLSGAMGSLDANVRRWLRQLKISLSSEELKEFVGQASVLTSRSGMKGKFFDFNGLMQEDSDASIMVVYFQDGEEHLFVKMTGEKSLLERERERFLDLNMSLRGGAL